MGVKLKIKNTELTMFLAILWEGDSSSIHQPKPCASEPFWRHKTFLI